MEIALFNAKKRSKQQEYMDTHIFDAPTYQQLLTDLKTVNKYLGGFAITYKAIDKLLQQKKLKEVTIVDVGCGDGEQLRYLSKKLKNSSISFQFIGIDYKEEILAIATHRSKQYHNITFKKANILDPHCNLPKASIYTCSLFLHHFNDKQIINIINGLLKNSTLGVVINDLHRSWWAFYLFKIFSILFIKTEVAKYDGLVSVASGFTFRDFKTYKLQINGSHKIQWKWAFRYLWTIKKKN